MLILFTGFGSDLRMFGLEDVETFPGFQHDSLGRGCQEGDMPSTMHSEAVIDGEVEYEYGMNGPGKLRVSDNFSASSASICNLVADHGRPTVWLILW